MDEEAAAAGLVEAVENASKPSAEPTSTRCLRILGHPYRRNQQRLLASIGIAATPQGAEQRLLA
jgi:hypothetical protein